MKNKISLFTALLFSIVIFSQQSSISGVVKNQLNQPIEFANIAIEGKSQGAVTDKDGNFTVTNLKSGSYIVRASYVGYYDSKLGVSIGGNQNMTLNFELKEQSVLLQAVEVTGRKAKTYDNAISYAATKIGTSIKNTPQTISYVTKEVMDDQQAYTINDVVKNISGVNQFSFYDDFTIRGFRSQQETINGLRVIGLFGPQALTANLERVEVIKGPSSILFGNGSPGGTMNRVTKKPLDEDRKALTFTTGSFNTLRSTLDFTGKLNESKSLLYRLNMAYENSNSFRDLQQRKSFMVAPSISFLPTDKTRINFDLVITNFDNKLDRGQPIFGASAGTDLNSTPINFAIGAANDFHLTESVYSTLSLSHEFTDNFSFNASYMRFGYEEDLFEHRTSNRFAVDADGNQIPTLMGMRISARNQKFVTDNVSSFFKWETKTGAIEHKILVGFDYYQNTRPVGGGNIFTSSGAIYRTVDGGLATYDPDNRANFLFGDDGNPLPNIPHFDLENPTYNLAFPSDYILGRNERGATKEYSSGIYIQDQIKWNKLNVLVGLRQEYFKNIVNFEEADEEIVDQQKLLPRLGVVYEATKSINVYGTYTESFQPVGANTLLDLETEGLEPFEPFEGQMFEAGIKSTFFKDRLSANFAVYKIDNKNIIINDPDTGFAVQRGAEEATGFEVDINGRIGSSLSITANYAYNDASITESDVPDEIGLQKENAPFHSGGFFANYAFKNSPLNGVNVNFGTNFVSERNTFERDLQLPSYLVSMAGISYKINKVKLALTVNNIFNETHWVGGYSYVRLFPGAPRNYLLSIGYTF
ncbi:TonB-dependent receptor [Maribacter antarcticus]|uniref:TonB-dependent receptor n=1 Tax=Maribacter antarcticus TaxID=505250 RepID=UPI00047E5D95|nr:TonB-dependent receptor [Maribacter antarcticus]